MLKENSVPSLASYDTDDPHHSIPDEAYKGQNGDHGKLPTISLKIVVSRGNRFRRVHDYGFMRGDGVR